MGEKAAESEEQVRPPLLKRKRVALACESCRARKAKCDNRRPICGRCEGYGYKCTWEGGRRRIHLEHDHAGQSSQRNVHESLELIREICSTFPQDVQSEVDGLLALVRSHVIEDDSPAPSSKDTTAMPPAIGHSHSSRYLGQASDIHFLNLARQTFRTPDPVTDQAEDVVESYDEDKTCLPRPLSSWVLDSPGWSAGEKYLSSYFSTIHAAYPFLPRSYFLHKYKNLQSKNTGNDQLTAAWLALFYGVLAIGAFYDQGAPPVSSKDLHANYFQRSILLTDLNKLEASAVQVSALLVQCFYLLATSKTDRCWITLGVAIRLAQALGMHMDYIDAKPKPWGYPLPQPQRSEIRRRVWYSLFVLDRLVALQLGRPPAISDGGFSVSLPSNLDDGEHDWEAEEALPNLVDEPSAGTYFLRVIELSKIIGRVLQELNEAQKPIEVRLSRVKQFDNELSAWKSRLPRYLRFDVVHVFDNSPHFKRQRNMLAIKYHHLRALMHRPYLSLPAANGFMAESLTDHQIRAVHDYSQTCISEARETARLFHNVQDEVQLIYDYPWWQLISCVVCAASILIVAGTFKQMGAEVTEAGGLCDDAETCLKVLGALSSHSTGARHARHMVAKLLSQRLSYISQSSPEDSRQPLRLGELSKASQPGNMPRLSRQTLASVDTTQLETANTHGNAPYAEGLTFPWLQTDDDLPAEFDTGLSWPYGTLDSMAWSSQVLNSMMTSVDCYVPAPPGPHDGLRDGTDSPQL
ncbi:fungal-specific transcription factor domain-containing protein [Thelonectria olida]|uniref:Fungal-specific transcription factor domain-containing protein n=1 Tax=Thelonectria olida TaxID=1576542 RepID=A0A9P8W3R7_9HYPO|nr:fungal-specific transcription factor domain-containing protein [Thelonectria olida]